MMEHQPEKVDDYTVVFALLNTRVGSNDMTAAW